MKYTKAELKELYIKGNFRTYKEFAEKYKLNLITVSLYGAKYKWNEEKSRYLQSKLEEQRVKPNPEFAGLDLIPVDDLDLDKLSPESLSLHQRTLQELDTWLKSGDIKLKEKAVSLIYRTPPPKSAEEESKFQTTFKDLYNYLETIITNCEEYFFLPIGKQNESKELNSDGSGNSSDIGNATSKSDELPTMPENNV